ncbi:Outer membrane protein beta-barrel domain-containing protein [Solimonas aquatica]|uniref:Outer membrane protein beta-barrel domain-containing protein n=2 Tax=Solimonas aquatica TaxID=489703 RepID=A0A1H9BT55_9GAMM|nr:Outer membrane protein beta-barrel domain-containing protein [Solimonas aquatica]
MQLKTMKAAALLTLAVSGISTAAAADEPYALRPYFDLGPSFTFADDNDRHSGDATGYFAGVGVPLARYFGLEANISQAWFDRNDAPDNLKWRERGGELNALFTYPMSDGWVPYLSVGGSFVQSRLNGGGKSSDPAYSYAGGVFKYFKAGSQDLGLRLEARYRYLNVDEDKIGGAFTDNNVFNELILRLGLVVPFGSALDYGNKPAAAAPVDPDSDGDGVPDSKDKCPDTPKGVKVDETGCPLPAKVGAPAPKVKSFGPVYFDFDKADLKAAERAKLDNALKIVQDMKNPKIVLRLNGHTDDVGTPEYNVGLGERRAQTVKKYLADKGYKGEFQITSFGETKPAADNGTEQGRALNRRVEVEAFENN